MKFFATFVGVLFVGYALAGSSVGSGENHQLNEHNVLFKSTVREFLKVSLSMAERGATVCRHILEEVKHNANWPGAANDMNVLENSVQEAERIVKSENEQTLPNVLTTIQHFTEHVYTLYTKAVSGSGVPAMAPLKEAFEKHGFKNLIDNFRHNFVQFFEKFTVEFQQYAEKLNASEKQTHVKLFEWFNDFKGQNEFRVKFNKFQQFFRFFQAY